MTLYENFNTSQQMSPHFERHEKFVGNIQLPSCAMVQVLEPEERCGYIQETDVCYENVFVLNYYEMLYCGIDPRSGFVMFLGIGVLLLFCALYFMILGATADGFFCPSLKVVSKMLGMNENVAGVTLLAFGNGAPDLFTNIAGLSGESRRLYSDVYGAAVFVVCVVGGSIITLVPFVTVPSSFMRDVCFLLLGVIVVDYTAKSGNYVSLEESICILVIYIAYIIVVIVDQALLKSAARREIRQSQDSGTSRASGIVEEANIEILGRHNRASVNPLLMQRVSFGANHSLNYNLVGQLAETLHPIDEEEFNESGRLMRVIIFIKVPLVFILTLLIPVVDYEKPRHGWSKLLNVSQIIILPIVIILGSVGDTTLFTVPLYLYTLIVSVPLSVYIFSVTRTDIPPSRHRYLSILGCVGSVFVVYAVANEMINALEVLGVTTYRSNSFLGCTLLAWGNSIGDLVANVTLARQGYEKMGFSACFGGPLFNSLVSIGISFIYKVVENDMRYEIGEGTMGENCSIFLIVSLFTLILASSTTNFVLRRSIGIILLFLYGLFFLYTFLGELEILHTYGTDHGLDLRVEPVD